MFYILCRINLSDIDSGIIFVFTIVRQRIKTASLIELRIKTKQVISITVTFIIIGDDDVLVLVVKNREMKEVEDQKTWTALY